MNSAEKPWKKTACILCSLNCGLEVQTDGRRIVKIRGDDDHPASHGYICEKSQRMDFYQNGSDRLTSPMRRRADGSYEVISWETAIREIANKFKAIRSKYGGESILYYGGGGQGNHLGGAYGDATLKALGVKYRSNALPKKKPVNSGFRAKCSEPACMGTLSAVKWRYSLAKTLGSHTVLRAAAWFSTPSPKTLRAR